LKIRQKSPKPKFGSLIIENYAKAVREIRVILRGKPISKKIFFFHFLTILIFSILFVPHVANPII